MIRLPSPSEMARGIACPPSFAEGSQITEPARFLAARGTTAHAFIRNVLGGMAREAALEIIPADDPGLPLCERLNLDKLPKGGHLEVAFAWNPDSGEPARILGYDIDRAYEEHGADRTKEIAGTSDFAGQVDTNTAIVADWKSGWATAEAAESWQLRTLAVMAADAFGVGDVVVAHVHIGDGEPRWETVTFGPLELAAFREQLRAAVRALRSSKPPEVSNLKEGAHCRYCPVKKRCPAKVALVRELVADVNTAEERGIFEVGISPEAIADLTPEKAAGAWVMLERYKDLARVIEEQLEAYAAEHPLELEDGRVVRLVPGQARDKVVDAQRAIEVLAEQLDEEAAHAAVRTDKTAIEDAARGWAQRTAHGIGQTVGAVLDALRERGIIVKVPGEEKVRAVKPPKPKKLRGAA